MLKFRFFATGTYEDWPPTYQGGISFNTAGSISTSVMWKLSPGKLPFPRTWNTIEMVIFYILSRKLDKNVNLFYLNMNFF